jgi:hypothetical protein
MDNKPDGHPRMGRLQIIHCKSLPIPPGTKSPVKGGSFFFAEERAARRLYWLKIGAVFAIFAALAIGIFIGRYLLH